MEKETLHLKFEGDQKELILRTGEAPVIQYPKGFELTTDIESVVDYYNKRKQEGDASRISKDNAHVLVDKNKGVITLVVDDMYPEKKITVTGKLIPDADYVALGINTERQFNEGDLKKLFQPRPHLFASPDSYSAFMKSLRDFTVKVKTEYSQSDNRTGSQSMQVKAVADTSGMQKEIQLKIGPWVTSTKEPKNINIYVDVTGGGVMYYLESTELMLNKEFEREEVVNKAVESLNALPIMYV